MNIQNGSSGRKYDFLEQLSVEDLESLLRLSSDSVETEAFLDAVTEVIVERERKAPTGRIPDVDTAWAEFQRDYNTAKERFQLAGKESKAIVEERRVASGRKQRSPLRPWRSVAVIAATLVISLACMVGVQATGLDVFGALARWTEETFHYALPTAEDNPIREALRNQGLPEELAPTWWPEGFLPSEPEVYESDIFRGVYITFENEDCAFRFRIRKFANQMDMPQLDYEKDSYPIETYVNYGRMFYIISNLDDTWATWTDGISLVIDIDGNITPDEIKSIINSMGG